MIQVVKDVVGAQLTSETIQFFTGDQTIDPHALADDENLFFVSIGVRLEMVHQLYYKPQCYFSSTARSMAWLPTNLLVSEWHDTVWGPG